MNQETGSQSEPPTRPSLLPYGRHSIDEEDIRAVVDVLRSDWLTTGPKVPAFEQAFAHTVGARHAVSFSSGTAALHGAVFAAGLRPGDEAITTPLTFAATSNSILYVGARPRFADVEPQTLNLDPTAVAEARTPKTKAVLPVDYAGHPAQLQAFLDLAEDHDLTVIEDACHALGATYRQRRVGSISHLTVFSFHPAKHITTGEGGMVTTDDAALARRLMTFRNHGIASDARERQARGQWHYEMVELGYNYRLTDLASALGLSQLSKLDRFLARRRAIAQRYAQGFASLPELVLPVVRPEVEHAWHLYPVRLRSDRLKGTRDDIFRALRGLNVGVNVHYIPVHLHPYYRQHLAVGPGTFPVAEAAYASLLTLPLFPAMTDADVEYVIAAVTRTLRRFARS